MRNFAPAMDKRPIVRALEWGVAVAACAYLIWRLAMYDDYASLLARLRDMGIWQWGALVLCVVLMPVNMLLEAWRWRTLMNHQSPIPNDKSPTTNHPILSWREAQRQVYYSKMAGLVTPWRLGEYPARGLLMQSPMTNDQSSITNKSLWSRVLSMGAVGSATMTLAIVAAGLLALFFSPSVLAVLGDSYLYSLVAVLAVLAVLVYFAPRALKKWAQLNGALLWTSLAQSFVRLLCWCVQLALVLWALSPFPLLQSPITIYQLPIYYLLVTITPNVPVAEVGVRGAWAMFLFGTADAALAGVLLWVINTLLPCLIWSFLRKKQNKFAHMQILL